MRPAPGPRSLLIALACLALAPAAHAAGVSLRWDTCYGNGGVQNKNFACDNNIGYRGPNTARVRIAEAVPANNFKDLVAGQEYYSCDLTIDYQKTVGTGSCAGCSTPACLVLTSINLTTPVVENNRLLTGPANGVDSNWATWQGGGGVVVGGQAGCPAATPTAKSTWGAVK